MSEAAPAPVSHPSPFAGRRRVVVDELRGAAGSLTFLTRLPLGNAVVLDAGDLARAVPYFPLIGAAIGGLVALLAIGMSDVVDPLLGAVVAVAGYAALTGALHLDAVADTFDALGTSSRAEALRVMREPTIGAFGATALFLDLFLRTALLAVLVVHRDFVSLLIVVGAISRVGPALLLAALPYARPEGGVATAFSRGSWIRALVAFAVAVVLSAYLLQWVGLVLVAALLLVIAILGDRFRHWLGGVTGDTLGCSVEILEIAGLSVGLALISFGVLR